MRTDFDVVAVGAGPAGTAAVFRLHQRGYRVLLIDKSVFPRSKPCGGGITIKALKLLPWSAAPVLETATRRLRMGVTGGRSRRDSVFETDGHVCTFAVRAKFDAFNLGKVVQAGVAFEPAAGLSSIAEDEGCVRVTIGTRTVIAKYLVGADGANSTVRRLTGMAPSFHRGFAIEGIVANDAVQVPIITEFLFGEVGNGYGWMFPKGDHVNVGIFTWDSAVSLGKDRLREYVRHRLGIDAVSDIIGFPIGFGGRDYVQDRERIVLAGDAGGFAEPLLGEGIHNAIKSGQAAADAIVAVETGEAASLRTAYQRAITPIRDDLATYERAKRLFYGRLDTIGYRALAFPLVRSAMMRGFAAGMTLHEITHPFPFSLMYLASPLFRRSAPIRLPSSLDRAADRAGALPARQ